MGGCCCAVAHSLSHTHMQKLQVWTDFLALAMFYFYFYFYFYFFRCCVLAMFYFCYYFFRCGQTFLSLQSILLGGPNPGTLRCVCTCTRHTHTRAHTHTCTRHACVFCVYVCTLVHVCVFCVYVCTVLLRGCFLCIRLHADRAKIKGLGLRD